MLGYLGWLYRFGQYIFVSTRASMSASSALLRPGGKPSSFDAFWVDRV